MVRFFSRVLRSILWRFGIEVGFYVDLDPQATTTIRRVEPYTMTSIARLFALIEAVRYVVRAKIDGDIVECGVWRGGSMMAAALTLLECGERSRDLHLFDTYDGMSSPTAKDVAHNGQDATSFLATADRSDPHVWCNAPVDDVRNALWSTGYEAARMHFIQGKVEETLPDNAPEKIAILRLDTDWYESTRHELEHLYPRLVRGGVLIIDDYGHWEGCRQAVDEYIKAGRLKLLLNRVDYTGRIAIKLD